MRPVEPGVPKQNFGITLATPAGEKLKSETYQPWGIFPFI
jgi:hypothetical protein